MKQLELDFGEGNGMPKYRVSVPVETWKVVVVSAQSPQEAADKAVETGVPCLCQHCAALVEVGEFDGEILVETMQ